MLPRLSYTTQTVSVGQRNPLIDHNCALLANHADKLCGHEDAPALLQLVLRYFPPYAGGCSTWVYPRNASANLATLVDLCV